MTTCFYSYSRYAHSVQIYNIANQTKIYNSIFLVTFTDTLYKLAKLVYFSFFSLTKYVFILWHYITYNGILHRRPYQQNLKQGRAASTAHIITIGHVHFTGGALTGVQRGVIHIVHPHSLENILKPHFSIYPAWQASGTCVDRWCQPRQWCTQMCFQPGTRNCRHGNAVLPVAVQCKYGYKKPPFDGDAGAFMRDHALYDRAARRHAGAFMRDHALYGRAAWRRGCIHAWPCSLWPSSTETRVHSRVTMFFMAEQRCLHGLLHKYVRIFFQSDSLKTFILLEHAYTVLSASFVIITPNFWND